jgi:diguanylate cyclase (GGDEF)-like protein
MNELRGVPRDRMVPLRQRNQYILIAMPNVTRATAFRAAVAGSGYDASVVRDGDEARQEFTRRGAPVLLILDASLPKVDGFELLRELRQLASRQDAAAIVVSGHGAIRTAARRLSEQLGISKILPFDVDRTALREAIDGALHELGGRTPAAAPAVLPHDGRADAPGTADDPIDSAVLAAVRRFRGAITVCYVKTGAQEEVRGYFSVPDLAMPLNTGQSTAFLRQLAQTSDTLIVPNLATYPALNELAPGGLASIRGLAAAPIVIASRDVSGVLCVMDTRVLSLDAADLDALDAIVGDMVRDLGGDAAPATATAGPSAVDIDSLERLASADPLTGLANRRGGEKDISAEISRARRQNTPLSCVLLDIDHFKDVNDTFGHQAGDYVLREISALLRRTVRAYDVLVRWGGEEFLVVLPGVEQEQALKLAERIRAAIENLPLAGIGGVTASVGVACLGTDYSFEAMFAAADRRLYSAKSSGRNTVA